MESEKEEDHDQQIEEKLLPGQRVLEYRREVSYQ